MMRVKSLHILLMFLLAVAVLPLPAAEAVQAAEDGPNPRAKWIKKVDNGRDANVAYLQRTAAKILERWSLYEQTDEADPLKRKLYDFSVKQKDALISRIYALCNDSADPENEYCQIYADTVRLLGKVPDLVPGKWN